MNLTRLGNLTGACAVGAFLVCSVLGLGGSAWATHDPNVAFTDPTTNIPMPEDWIKEPIRHEGPEPVDLVVALDQQLFPALGPMIQQFAAERGKRIEVQNGTCGISASALAEKTADMGGFCCPPGLSDRLPGLKYHTIGIGALAIIVHPDNPIDGLSSQKARQLFGGDLVAWGEVPMSGYKASFDAPVRAITRQHCKLRPGHWRLILDSEQAFSFDSFDVAAITDMIGQVARTASAIGYETLWHIDRLSEDQGRVKTLHIDGADPRDPDTVATGRHPFYRVFNITTWEGAAANPLSDSLADYLIERAHEIAPEFAIVPASRLRHEGWRFHGNEIIAAPPR